MVDLVYGDNGIFTWFLPESVDGENAWRQIAVAYEKTDENMRPRAGSVYTAHLPGLLRKLRKAGYVVKKSPKIKGKVIDHLTAEDLALLDQLGN
jgi:hypothetical protein